jgi:NADH-quinone oxidoreductase subunit M
MMIMLYPLLIIPFITTILIVTSRNNEQVRRTALTGTGVQLIYAFYVLFRYLEERARGNTDMYLFTSRLPWFRSLQIGFDTGVDGIAVAMIVLTAVVVFTGVLASWNVEHRCREFFSSLIILATGTFGFFLSLDLFVMFLFFELAVIPMYLLIGIWGSGPKEYSAMKLTLMLMGGSALLIIGILGIYFHSDIYGHPTFYLPDLLNQSFPDHVQRWIFPFVFIGFGVIGALFPLHTWSPDGHSSAPTAVSMLHAGVLMKLGGYGCLKVAIGLFPHAAHEQAWIFLILTSISIVYGALGVIGQNDLKYINAYSSVSHCGMVLFALLMLNETALTGAVLQMVSHGLMTALFFALIGMIYERTHTRLVNEMGGLLRVMPYLGVCYMIAGLTSLGLPGLSGFVSELTIFFGAWQHQGLFYRIITVGAISSVVITAVYILQVVARLLMGPLYAQLPDTCYPASVYEKAATAMLIAGLVIIGIVPGWLADMIAGSLKVYLR